MSLLSRNALRTVGRPVRQVRSYTSTPAYKSYLAEQAALEHHAAETSDLWRKISFFVCLPGIAVCTAWVYNAEVEHHHHLDHLRAENDGNLPEVPGFEYMNRRIKPFPWGMNSLFFNPHMNKNLEEE
ncbi:COX6A, subunit VIa of cytochrome c oxidase [Lyophyllum atratum]|nr:COX6A, subunit VIa of cytochrome c oxidase [Lyophyllum atratum]